MVWALTTVSGDVVVGLGNGTVIRCDQAGAEVWKKKCRSGVTALTAVSDDVVVGEARAGVDKQGHNFGQLRDAIGLLCVASPRGDTCGSCFLAGNLWRGRQGPSGRGPREPLEQWGSLWPRASRPLCRSRPP